MKPIAPRYRRPVETADESNSLARPILTIPDWNIQHTEIAEAGEGGEGGLDSESAGPQDTITDSEIANTSDDEKRPAGGRFRDTIHVYWSTARTRTGLKLPRRLPEAIRGILPGIGISISLMFVWFLIKGGSNEPSPSDLADQSSSAVIKPISEDPLRVPLAAVASSEPTSTQNPSARVAAKPESLFNDVPIIDRDSKLVDRNGPKNTAEASSQEPNVVASQIKSDATFNTAGSPSSVSPAVASDSATQYEWSPSSLETDSASQPLTVAKRPTVNASLNQGRQAPTAPRQRQSRTQPRRNQPAKPSSDDLQPNYSYQTTDPATYKDPDYIVPPVARRQVRDSVGEGTNLDSPATSRETPGRSRR